LEDEAFEMQLASESVIPARFEPESILSGVDDRGFRLKTCRNDDAE
jgi:hypothetical protein